ncbi:MAG: hypothetical protein HXS54_01365 [Theionarchaea archaeon]|nr:hypothetical protein [Theionarchaea archaeon]
MTILGFDVSAILILIGVIGLIGAFLGVQLKNFSRTGLAICSVVILGIGAYGGGYLDNFISTDQSDAEDDGGTDVTDQYLTEGLNMEAFLKDAATKAVLASKTVGLYPEGTTLIDIQSAKVTPLDTATTDANGKATFYGLTISKYVIAFYDDEDAFDGTDYAAASKTVELKKIPVLLGTSTTVASPDPTLYIKKLSDVFYTITATSGSNSSSGGVNADATITESGTAGTTAHVTVSCGTDKAWLTDTAYYQRVYLTDVFTDNGDANTAITLADCRLNSSTGQNITKDSSASYYVDVTTEISKNTTLSQNQTFSFTIWIPDLGDIGTTADTYAVTFKHTLIRKDSTNQTILADTGLKVTVTQANSS